MIKRLVSTVIIFMVDAIIKSIIMCIGNSSSIYNKIRVNAINDNVSNSGIIKNDSSNN